MFLNLITGTQLVALALVIGGLLALGAISAPVLFQNLARPEAGEVMAVMFKRFDTVLLVCAILILLCEVLRFFLGATVLGDWKSWTRLASVAVLLLLMATSLFMIHPKLNAIRTTEGFQNNGPLKQEFQAKHKQSESFAKTQLLLGVLVLLLTP